ncbi:UDP-N-acetylmuramoyl-tripeptide--D-alanyl-D-alanine ligase [Dehalobacter sp. TBBPA1]|uniref:UDP-N-acetylmuramoyl-tripeptide--D-alanyl-D- alanine ligase n=1 Tax=Dehalobacter sp. TBBPA1 TaxID=3235037 RepID=UPI0034A51587
MWNSGIIAEILGGRLYGSESAYFEGCVIDSRAASGGALFTAIRGEKTDGHLFINKAFEAGASIALAETHSLEELGIPVIPAGKAIIAVKDSLRALQDLARAWRKTLDPVVIGITGSCGKTTTKDMTAAVLAKGFKVHKNLENHNNEIGLPLTILNAPAGTEIMVLEMGMRGLGQVRALCDICSPSVAVITNIGTTHLELLGSQENIAKAKWELIDALSGGIAVLNAEDAFSVSKAATAEVKKVFYGISGKYVSPDVYAVNIRSSGTLTTCFEVVSGEDRAEVRLPLPGEHNVLDALAALSVGLAKGVSLAEGAKALEELELSKMRLEIQQGVFGSTIINDVYNANPTSMKASLHVLAESGGAKTIAVLGEMYELGDFAVSGHRDVGRAVAELGIDTLITVGKMAEDIAQGASEAGFPASGIHICSECAEAVSVAKKLIEEMGSDVWVLVKGSRGMRMERVSGALCQEE